MSNTKLGDSVGKTFNNMDGSNIPKVIKEADLLYQFVRDVVEKYQNEVDELIAKYKSENVIITGAEAREGREKENFRELIPSEEPPKNDSKEKDALSQSDDDELSR